MTSFGRFLERTKLDELPQLWNILKGEMSFVGPRPESKRFAHLFSGEYKAVLRYVPGIFGPSQVKYRNEGMLYPPDEDPDSYYSRVLFPGKAQLDIGYFSKANILRDIGWILRGITATILGAINWQIIAVRGPRIIVDAVLIAVAWTLANYARFGDIPQGQDFDAFVRGLMILPMFLMLCMNIGGCYRHPLRYFSAYDARRMFQAVSVGWIAGYLLVLGSSTRTASLSLLPLGWLPSLLLLAILRIWLRIRKEPRRHLRPTSVRKVLVYGAGRTGIALAEWMSYGPDSLRFIGFIDDDHKLRGHILSGHRVLGRESDIPTIETVHGVNEIWVTFRPDELKRTRLQQSCIKNGIKCFILCDVAPFAECREEKVLY
ncbi:MAG: sugar transferase, partial [Methylococcales bacterium]